MKACYEGSHGNGKEEINQDFSGEECQNCGASVVSYCATSRRHTWLSRTNISSCSCVAGSAGPGLRDRSWCAKVSAVVTWGWLLWDDLLYIPDWLLSEAMAYLTYHPAGWPRLTHKASARGFRERVWEQVRLMLVHCQFHCLLLWKQVGRPDEIHGVGKQTPPLHGRSCRVPLQSELTEGGVENWGHSCNH